ncbi:hypothetical protein ACFWPP_32115 [Streptomyces anulatus]|uniref:hypothetical protein n=1 Tax=Streptomyces anulatus TaxID=1892 RepID=UPI003648B393
MANESETGSWWKLEAYAWAVLGFIVGIYFSLRYEASIGARSVNEMSNGEQLTRIFLISMPALIYGEIGSQIGKEARKGRISWATHWVTLFSIATATFTLLGMAGIEDIYPAE